MITTQEIIKAKNTIYKHKNWFVGGSKTIYEAIKYFADCRDFLLDYKRNLNTYDVEKLGYEGDLTHDRVLNWLIEKGHYNLLKINFCGSEGGTDRGNLKIRLFLYLRKGGLENGK